MAKAKKIWTVSTPSVPTKPVGSSSNPTSDVTPKSNNENTNTTPSLDVTPLEIIPNPNAPIPPTPQFPNTTISPTENAPARRPWPEIVEKIQNDLDPTGEKRAVIEDQKKFNQRDLGAEATTLIETLPKTATDINTLEGMKRAVDLSNPSPLSVPEWVSDDGEGIGYRFSEDGSMKYHYDENRNIVSVPTLQTRDNITLVDQVINYIGANFENTGRPLTAEQIQAEFPQLSAPRQINGLMKLQQGVIDNLEFGQRLDANFAAPFVPELAGGSFYENQSKFLDFYTNDLTARLWDNEKNGLLRETSNQLQGIYEDALPNLDPEFVKSHSKIEVLAQIATYNPEVQSLLETFFTSQPSEEELQKINNTLMNMRDDKVQADYVKSTLVGSTSQSFRDRSKEFQQNIADTTVFQVPIVEQAFDNVSSLIARIVDKAGVMGEGLTLMRGGMTRDDLWDALPEGMVKTVSGGVGVGAEITFLPVTATLGVADAVPGLNKVTWAVENLFGVVGTVAGRVVNKLADESLSEDSTQQATEALSTVLTVGALKGLGKGGKAALNTPYGKAIKGTIDTVINNTTQAYKLASLIQNYNRITKPAGGTKALPGETWPTTTSEQVGTQVSSTLGEGGLPKRVGFATSALRSNLRSIKDIRREQKEKAGIPKNVVQDAVDLIEESDLPPEAKAEYTAPLTPEPVVETTSGPAKGYDVEQTKQVAKEFDISPKAADTFLNNPLRDKIIEAADTLTEYNKAEVESTLVRGQLERILEISNRKLNELGEVGDFYNKFDDTPLYQNTFITEELPALLAEKNLYIEEGKVKINPEVDPREKPQLITDKSFVQKLLNEYKNQDLWSERDIRGFRRTIDAYGDAFTDQGVVKGTKKAKISVELRKAYNTRLDNQAQFKELRQVDESYTNIQKELRDLTTWLVKKSNGTYEINETALSKFKKLTPERLEMLETLAPWSKYTYDLLQNGPELVKKLLAEKNKQVEPWMSKAVGEGVSMAAGLLLDALIPGSTGIIALIGREATSKLLKNKLKRTKNDKKVYEKMINKYPLSPEAKAELIRLQQPEVTSERVNKVKDIINREKERMIAEEGMTPEQVNKQFRVVSEITPEQTAKEWKEWEGSHQEFMDNLTSRGIHAGSARAEMIYYKEGLNKAQTPQTDTFWTPEKVKMVKTDPFAKMVLKEIKGEKVMTATRDEWFSEGAEGQDTVTLLQDYNVARRLWKGFLKQEGYTPWVVEIYKKSQSGKISAADHYKLWMKFMGKLESLGIDGIGQTSFNDTNMRAGNYLADVGERYNSAKLAEDPKISTALNNFGLKVEIDPETLNAEKAVGMYNEGVITLKEDTTMFTFFHEMMHGIFDKATSAEQKALLEWLGYKGIDNKYKTTQQEMISDIAGYFALGARIDRPTLEGLDNPKVKSTVEDLFDALEPDGMTKFNILNTEVQAGRAKPGTIEAIESGKKSTQPQKENAPPEEKVWSPGEQYLMSSVKHTNNFNAGIFHSTAKLGKQLAGGKYIDGLDYLGKIPAKIQGEFPDSTEIGLNGLGAQHVIDRHYGANEERVNDPKMPQKPIDDTDFDKFKQVLDDPDDFRPGTAVNNKDKDIIIYKNIDGYQYTITLREQVDQKDIMGKIAPYASITNMYIKKPGHVNRFK